MIRLSTIAIGLSLGLNLLASSADRSGVTPAVTATME